MTNDISNSVSEQAEPQSIPDHQTLEWHEGDMPYSREFGDHFYCRSDGRLECDHVFLSGNGLPQRWKEQDRFSIGELGFGTGLNFCETWRQWKISRPENGTLHYVSFERFPMQREEITKALSRWPELDAERQALAAAWPEAPQADVRLEFGDAVTLVVVNGSALDTVGSHEDRFDAWYLDGFAPSRNPDMWSLPLMQAVFEKTVEAGSFATYAAAGFVRRNLQAAGFAVERTPGFAGKREMLCGRKGFSLL